MNITIRVIVVAFTMTCASYSHGMEKQEGALKVYVVPGLGGHKEDDRKSHREYSEMLFKGDDVKTNVDITYIATPAGYGLAQKKCKNYVKSALQKDLAKDAKEGKKYDKRVVLAFSQGAATIIDLMKEGELQIPDLRIVFTEGLPLSFNDALYDSVHGLRSESYGILKGLPYIRYWLPLLAKMLLFSHYKPAGQQPLHALQHIRKDLPFAIIHGEWDQRVRFKDNAPVVYSWLWQQRIGIAERIGIAGKKHLFFIPKEGSDDAIAQERDHVTVLDPEDVPKVHAILREYKVFPPKEGTAASDKVLLATLQPTPTAETLKEYITLYHSKHAQHKIHEYIEQGLDAATIVASAAVIYWTVKTMLKRDFAINAIYPDVQFILANALTL